MIDEAVKICIKKGTFLNTDTPEFYRFKLNIRIKWYATIL